MLRLRTCDFGGWVKLTQRYGSGNTTRTLNYGNNNHFILKGPGKLCAQKYNRVSGSSNSLKKKEATRTTSIWIADELAAHGGQLNQLYQN